MGYSEPGRRLSASEVAMVYRGTSERAPDFHGGKKPRKSSCLVGHRGRRRRIVRS